jgi:hypothetical protein
VDIIDFVKADEIDDLMRIIQARLKGKQVRLEPAGPRHARGSKSRAKKPTPRKRTRAA